MNNYIVVFVLFLVSGISDIFILGLNKVTNTTNSPAKLIVQIITSKINKPSIHSSKNISHTKIAINKKALYKPAIPIRPITQRLTTKSTTKTIFIPKNKTETSLWKSLLWFDVFYITSDKKEPDEIFPVDEGFLLVTVKKSTTKIKPTTTKKLLTSRTFTKSPANKINSSTLKSVKQLTSTVKTRNEKSLPKPVQRKLLQIHATTLSYGCKNNSDCHQNNNEICMTRDQRRECTCISGFSRHHYDDRTCYAFKAYKCTIWLTTPFNYLYQEFQSLEFLEISAMLMDVLKPYLIIEDQVRRYNKYFIKMIPSRFSPYTTDVVNRTAAECYLLFHKDGVKNVTATSIQTLLHNITSDERVRNFQITDLYVCEDMELNYCSSNANCMYHAHDHSATCECKPGFKDISDKLLMPTGAECQDLCYTDYCMNGGQCIVEENEKICKCSIWFVMGRCELDLRWVLPLAGGCLVVALIFIFSAVHIYYREKKKYIKRPLNHVRRTTDEDTLFKRYGSAFQQDIPVSLGQNSDQALTDCLSEISQNYFPRARLKL